MTDELKELLKNAKSAEEAKALLEKHKDDLTDTELDEIAGGTMTLTLCFIASAIDKITGSECYKG